MGEPRRQLARVPSGIAGLDQILEGGFPSGGAYIVQGPPGAGKTILANQICFNHAARGARALYVTLLAEAHSRMFAHLERMRFFDAALIPSGVYYLGAFTTLDTEGLGALTTLVRAEVQKHEASLLVIDGLVSARESAPSDRDFKKFIHEIQTIAAALECTVIMITNTERATRTFPEHTMVDGVLHLTDELSQLRPLRHVQVLKLRGAAPVRGLHSVRISDGGFHVYPRLETRFGLTRDPEQLVAAGPKLGFGLPELDAMLHGGVRQGSLTMLVGSSGSGKTLFGMQFLAEGIRRGERGVYFGFYERPQAILEKCRRVGIGGIKEGVERGDAEVLWHRPVEGIVDELGASLIETVRRTGATRLVVDGIQGFEIAADFKERLSDVYSALAQELESLGVTTIYTVESRGLFEAGIYVPIVGLSAATQNIVLLRHVEQRARIRRALAIIKLRDSDYDSSMREVRFTEAGIRLLDTLAGQPQLMSGGGVADTSPTAAELRQHHGSE